MHDPMTVAWDVKNPFVRARGIRTKDGKESKWRTRPTLITIWHVDPEKGPGGDDSCGWFKRAHHGNPEVLDKIEKRFEEDWDRTWTYDPSEDCESEDKTNTTYPCGYFFPNGMPRFSVHGIVLNLFLMAACEHFSCDGSTNWKKAKQFMRKHYFDIALFAENPTDSLVDSITMKFGSNDGGDRQRRERIKHMAAIIYGWILRAEQKWWQHPRWHIHHWKLQIHCLQDFKRWAFSRCCKCGKGFSLGYCPVSNQWNGTGPLWFRSEQGIMHSDCSDVTKDTTANKESATV
jgi:hypothetical protein